MKTLVYIEIKNNKPLNGFLELIHEAMDLGEGTAVLIGKDCEDSAKEVSRYGIPVLVLDTEAVCQDTVLAALVSAAADTQSELILLSATQTGKDLAPRLAARLDTGCITDVVGIRKDGESLIFTRPAYGGTVLEDMQFAEGKKAVATVRGGSFTKAEAAQAGDITVKSIEIPADAVKAKLVETAVEITELVNLEGAEVIVAGGRGCGDAQTFGLVEELAKLLGGVVGASRPAIEEGWVSRAHQIGQSGKIVSPKLYIACGISGAMQHVSGMIGSDYIVAINKDEDAPIFDAADISIVGRCEEILPLMIEEIRARKA